MNGIQVSHFIDTDARALFKHFTCGSISLEIYSKIITHIPIYIHTHSNIHTHTHTHILLHSNVNGYISIFVDFL